MRMGRKEDPQALFDVFTIGAATVKKNKEVPPRVKTELSYDPTIPHLEMHQRKQTHSF